MAGGGNDDCVSLDICCACGRYYDIKTGAAIQAPARVVEILRGRGKARCRSCAEDERDFDMWDVTTKVP